MEPKTSIESLVNEVNKSDIPSHYLAIQPVSEPSLKSDGLTPKTIVQIKEADGFFQVNDEPGVTRYYERKYMPRSIIMMGTNNSLWGQLGDTVQNLSNGPYYPKGQDNSLTFKNSKANGKTVASYDYIGGNGELLTFEVKSDFSISPVEAAKTADIDPDDKSLNIESAQVIPDMSSMFYEGHLVTEPNRIKEPQIDNLRYQGFQAKPSSSLSREVYSNSSRLSAFESIKDAQEKITANYQITDEDIQQYWDKYVKTIETLKSQPDWALTEKSLNELSTFQNHIINRTVTIRKQVDPLWYSTPTNEMLPTSTGNTNLGTNIYRRWDQGLEYLKKHPTIKLDPDQDLIRNNKVWVYEQMDIEIPIPGIRILASANFKDFQQKSVNDLIDSVSTKITASASVLGRPGLEDGMNIEVNNISSRYSGVWHTTKVVHTISNSSYTCDIEFVQKTMPLKTHQVTSKINLQNPFAELNKVAKESLKTGDYLKADEISRSVREIRDDLYKSDSNYLIQISEGGEKFTVRASENDFNPNGETYNIITE